MRLRSIANWALLCLNTFLFVILASRLDVQTGSLGVDADVRVAKRDAAALGKDLFFASGPFALFVAKDFPRDKSFTLMERGEPLFVMKEDRPFPVLAEQMHVDGEEPTREVTVGFGEHSSVSAEYSCSPKEGCRVSMLRLSTGDARRGETFSDYGAVGSFQMRQVRDFVRRTSQMYVWYQGDWQEVMGGDKDPKQDQFHKRLLDGTRVYFDTHRGEWFLMRSGTR
jgi:hypothetical protein